MSSFFSTNLTIFTSILVIFIIITFLVWTIIRISKTFWDKPIQYLIIFLQIFQIILILALLAIIHNIIVMIFWLDFVKIWLIEVQRFMLAENMIDELIFSVIFCCAVINKIANVRFVLGMPSLVVVSISYCCKYHAAETAWVRLYSRVDSLVYQ